MSVQAWRTLGSRNGRYKECRLTTAGRAIMVRRVVEGGRRRKALLHIRRYAHARCRNGSSGSAKEGLAGLRDRSSGRNHVGAADAAREVA